MVLLALAETIDWGLAACGIPEMWKQSRGRGVKVAVLNTGIDESHLDLGNVVLEARDFSGSVTGHHDYAGHGTHVAGIIAAQQNQQGIVGICPSLNEAGGGLLVGKVLGDEGAGTDASVVAGIEWAAAQGAHLISMSFGSPVPSTAIQEAIRSVVASGIFVICAAGNNGADNSVDYPGRWIETIAVAAVDRHGRVASFSSRGPEVAVAAPGQDVLSTYPRNRYAKLSGTSMATPFVTGVVALMLAKHREQGSQTPIQTVTQLREQGAHCSRRHSPGKDPAYG
jgi:major intracellular serine protease